MMVISFHHLQKIYVQILKFKGRVRLKTQLGHLFFKTRRRSGNNKKKFPYFKHQPNYIELCSLKTAQTELYPKPMTIIKLLNRNILPTGAIKDEKTKKGEIFFRWVYLHFFVVIIQRQTKIKCLATVLEYVLQTNTVTVPLTDMLNQWQPPNFSS